MLNDIQSPVGCTVQLGGHPTEPQNAFRGSISSALMALARASLPAVACFSTLVALATTADGQVAPTLDGAPSPPITLARSIQRALAQNASVVVAVEEIRRAEAQVHEARAQSFPTLTANGVYTRVDADREFGGRVILAKDQVFANLNLTVPLIVPQRWATWSHASSNVKTVRASSEETKRQIAVATAKTYLAVIAQKHVVDVDEHALKTAKAHYDYAHMRLLGGLGNRIDDVRAEQQVAADQALLEGAHAALARDREALGTVTGTDGPLDAVEDIPLASPPSLSAALEEARTNRPDVVANQTRLEAAEQVRKDGYTDYLPFLIGNIQPFYQHPESLTQRQTGWQAQLLLTIPIYDGGLRYGLAAERTSLSTEARAQYESILRQARSDVRVAFESVKRAESALVAATNAARLARSAAELATVAYRAGATTNLEVIDAERAAHQADTATAIAEDQVGQARIDLLAASGRFP